MANGMASSVKPDQTAPSWLGVALFAQACLPKYYW